MRAVKEYENYIGKLLRQYFAVKMNVVKEIRIRKGLRYRSEEGYSCYSPIIDISIGPFSEIRGENLSNEYDDLVHFSCKLINDLLQHFKINYEEFGRGVFDISERTIPMDYQSFLSTHEDVNWNARCFMAIEVENRDSKKHLLGDILNVSISGRVGIVIGYNDSTLKSFLRQLEYLAYTIERKKLIFNSRNVMVLKPEQFENILVKNTEKLYGKGV